MKYWASGFFIDSLPFREEDYSPLIRISTPVCTDITQGIFDTSRPRRLPVAVAVEHPIHLLLHLCRPLCFVFDPAPARLLEPTLSSGFLEPNCIDSFIGPLHDMKDDKGHCRIWQELGSPSDERLGYAHADHLDDPLLPRWVFKSSVMRCAVLAAVRLRPICSTICITPTPLRCMRTTCLRHSCSTSRDCLRVSSFYTNCQLKKSSKVR